MWQCRFKPGTVVEIIFILHVGELMDWSLTVKQHGRRLIKTFYFEP